jgi:hypothetical protein
MADDLNDAGRVRCRRDHAVSGGEKRDALVISFGVIGGSKSPQTEGQRRAALSRTTTTELIAEA